MNGDTLAIMQAISNARAEMLNAVGELKTEFASHKSNIDVRVENIEDEQKSSKTKQWIHSAIVFAAGAIHHDLGNWLNWKL
jgi:hypothetical protein